MTRTWNNKEVNEYLDGEGIGYAILHGLSAKYLEDEKLAVLWKDAEEALLKVERYLERY
jgi:hypothetical protein